MLADTTRKDELTVYKTMCLHVVLAGKKEEEQRTSLAVFSKGVATFGTTQKLC
jgi:hypothetical protein